MKTDKNPKIMLIDTLLMLAVLTLPLLAGAFMVWFMSTGRGNPAPTQDEIETYKKNQSNNA
ncbi:hypothetical protein JCM31826_09870 [Thermaurantimonas aggregans]|uniref:Uncharacterized protein n=2 Tax=Thermaurantimonas aggregans TaxID=2173829 RepID=A0A401XKE3_9FLAO|nr:hypothetical protein JCM31826_09870 [Thermaurantimonas aggregans]